MNSARSTGSERLSILSVAFPLFQVGPGKGGGAEEILRLLDAGLTARGHRSLVIAAEGSELQGRHVKSPSLAGQLDQAVRSAAQREHRRIIESVLTSERIDLVHFHGLDVCTYRPKCSDVPGLATLHLPISWYPPALLDDESLHFNFVSNTQARTASTDRPHPVIENGIDLAQFQLLTEKGNYLAWLGRVCAEKAPSIALRVAHRLELPLKIAGPVHAFQEHQSYFSEEIQPALDARRIYIGPLNMSSRSIFLAQARCLLITSQAPETSSLVAMEAIASGTPVVALRSGALEEVVNHGTTGFVVDSEQEMMEAIPQTDRLFSRDCRRVAELRFSAERMTDQYIALYRRLIKKGAHTDGASFEP